MQKRKPIETECPNGKSNETNIQLINNLNQNETTERRKKIDVSNEIKKEQTKKR